MCNIEKCTIIIGELLVQDDFTVIEKLHFLGNISKTILFFIIVPIIINFILDHLISFFHQNVSRSMKLLKPS